jgi:hypothetical protein
LNARQPEGHGNREVDDLKLSSLGIGVVARRLAYSRRNGSTDTGLGERVCATAVWAAGGCWRPPRYARRQPGLVLRMA